MERVSKMAGRQVGESVEERVRSNGVSGARKKRDGRVSWSGDAAVTATVRLSRGEGLTTSVMERDQAERGSSKSSVNRPSSVYKTLQTAYKAIVSFIRTRTTPRRGLPHKTLQTETQDCRLLNIAVAFLRYCRHPQEAFVTLRASLIPVTTCIKWHSEMVRDRTIKLRMYRSLSPFKLISKY